MFHTSVVTACQPNGIRGFILQRYLTVGGKRSEVSDFRIA